LIQYKNCVTEALDCDRMVMGTGRGDLGCGGGCPYRPGVGLMGEGGFDYEDFRQLWCRAINDCHGSGIGDGGEHVVAG